MSSRTIIAKLERTDVGTSWGFRLVGGKDFGAPLTIQRVTPGSLATKCGLEVGDEIKMIAGTLTEGLRHSEAQQLIREAGNSVELKLERGGKTVRPTESEDTSFTAADVNANKPVPLTQNQTYSVTPKSFPSQSASSELPGDVELKIKTSVTGTSFNLSHSAKALTAEDFPPPPQLPEIFPEPPPLPPSVPAQTKSARFQEHEDGDAPHYQGFVDPSLQSRSFKLLQSAMESGEGISKLTIRSASPSQKPPIGTKPTLPKDISAPTVKPPKPVASQPLEASTGVRVETKVEGASEEQPPVHEVHAGGEITIDIPVERKTIVLPSKKTGISANQDPLTETIDVPTERKKIIIPSSKLSKVCSKEPDADKACDSFSAPDSEISNGKKKYFQSETLKLIQDQESGRPQIQVSPKTGVEIKMNQSKKLIKLEQNLEGGFAAGPPTSLATSYKVTSGVATESVTKQVPAPPGKSQVQVGKLGEARKLPAALGAIKVPVCTECKTSIRGPYVTALEKTWCPEHFVCAYPSCRVSLIDHGFVEEDGRLYCEHDYEQHFAPKCGKCGRGIVGEVVSALAQTFHANCFTCSKCHLPIAGGLFHTENGELYCEKDWTIIFQTKCHGCQFPIDDSDPWVDALSRMWHSDCFKCLVCQINLDGQSFYAKNGKPYCKKHGIA